MSQSERIAFIAHALGERLPLTAQMLQDRFEISRATAMRDIELLRDRVNMPITYDTATKSYQLAVDNDSGQVSHVPGMWLNASQAYAFLTLFNVTEAFDPGVLRPFLQPFRGVIKNFLVNTGFPMRSFDKKIRIEIPFDPPIGNLHLFGLCDAVANDTAVKVKGTRPNGRSFKGSYLVKELALRLDGWWATLAKEDDAQDTFQLNARDIEVL